MTAAQVLLHAGCCSLPTDLGKIAAAHDIKLISYESCAATYDMDIAEIYLSIGHMGFSFRDEQHYICAVNEKACGRMRRRWTTAHELAHVLLGHISEQILPLHKEAEQAADRFAAEMLAPMCVLHFCGVSSAEEIARLTGISKQASEIRLKELSALRRAHSEQMRLAAREGTDLRNTETFLPDGNARMLLEQYLPFIAEYITKASEIKKQFS